jgi:hypothetical protein
MNMYKRLQKTGVKTRGEATQDEDEEGGGMLFKWGLEGRVKESKPLITQVRES